MIKRYQDPSALKSTHSLPILQYNENQKSVTVRASDSKKKLWLMILIISTEIMRGK